VIVKRLALLAISLGVAVGVTAVSTGISHASVSAKSGVFSKTETIVRENLVDGEEHIVDRRTVTLGVDETTNLRGRQEIVVTWSGAHPTGGIVANQNSIDAQQEEYPMVLLECRGIDSDSVPSRDRLSPETCWTQDWSERYQDSFQTDFPPYRLDQFATPADRAQVVGAPSPLPAACKFLPAPTQHWEPFLAQDGQIYYGGPAGCAGQPPESQDVGGSALPSNETFGVTGLDGKGTADFDVWTSAENASLGCSQTVTCSLVAVPVMGISCDPSAKSLPVADRPTGTALTLAEAQCEAKGAFTPGQLVNPQGNEDLTVSGSLWWSPSNWRNRISVPLTFAVPASACEVVNSTNTIDIYGSELMIQATGQWAPHFCLNPKLFSFVHVQTGEPEARNLLATGSSEAAFTSYAQPGGYGKPVVDAPVALTGFAISYVIDGANGQPYTKLRLTPLLLAKLLTESYPAELPVQEEDPALSHNPLNITLDPEFIKLNPGITHGVTASESASELIALSSDSDVMEALTTYINDNPAARAWLNGKPDQWGMVVNPAYKGIRLPVDQWPLLSTFEPKAYYASDNNDCLHNSPVPYLPLVAAPLASLEDVSESMQFDIANSTTVCSQIDGTSVGEKLVALGEQTAGYRFMIGLTPLADDQRYQLRAAALQTSDGDFVAPDNASLRATVALLKPDKKTGTWPIPYRELSTPAGVAAYPGTMVVYAAVPTAGLPATDAKDFATLLRFAATAGQSPGFAVGQLPPGYLPMTKTNGLGALAQYSLAAATDVAAQSGVLPPLTPEHSSPPPTTTSTSTTTTTTTLSTTTTTSTPTTSTSTPTTPTTTATTTPTTISATPTTSITTTSTTAPKTGRGGSRRRGRPQPPARTVAVIPPLGRTPGIALGSDEFWVVLIVGLALLGLLGVPITFAVGRRRGRW
jgi:hypothetical protein